MFYVFRSQFDEKTTLTDFQNLDFSSFKTSLKEKHMRIFTKYVTMSSLESIDKVFGLQNEIPMSLKDEHGFIRDSFD